MTADRCSLILPPQTLVLAHSFGQSSAYRTVAAFSQNFGRRIIVA